MYPVVLAAATIGDKLDTVFYDFDMWIYHIFGSIQCGFLTIVSKAFTSLGDLLFVIPLVFVGLILALFKRTRKYGFVIIAAAAIGTLMTNIIIKPIILRIRPYNTLQANADYWKWYITAGRLSESDYSFPSGHTTAAFELATVLFICYRDDGKKKTAWIFPVLAFMVMCSRVYLMIHYPSDVIAGAVTGIIVGIAAYYLSLLALKICEKFPKLDAIDADRWMKNKISSQTGKTIIFISIAIIFCFAFILTLSEDSESVIRCAYDGKYDCQNEARVDDADYPPIDGEYYCKIHWKELSGEAG